MDFRLSDDQLTIQAIARDFAQKRIAPVAAELDASGTFPLENIREMGQLGLMGIEVPEEYGGGRGNAFLREIAGDGLDRELVVAETEIHGYSLSRNPTF